ncbi:MAG: peptide chain release factor N(5)-glutamine methyltransferase [Deltaproteobacteria bacterium]|nr:peptide chain release factor N(5)-glutamine methyltransferase [Deltaproteobacteria bacterium]
MNKTASANKPSSRPATVKAFLEWAAGRLKSFNVPDAQAEAEYLLSHGLKLKRHELFLNGLRPLAKDEEKTLREFIRRRTRREPSQYITGTAHFRGLELKVTRAVLIPRPETELIVDEALRAASSAPLAGKGELIVLDLCTGSGCIAISMCVEMPAAVVFATDISWDALSIASENARRLKVEGRIVFMHGSLFRALGGFKLKGAVDMILTNPPYVPEAELFGLEPEVKDHEPRRALSADMDGLTYIREIISVAPDYLGPGGRLIMEIGWGQDRAVMDMFEKDGRYMDIRVIKDLSGVERIFSAGIKRKR